MAAFKGTQKKNTMRGSNGADVMRALAGNDVVLGRSGNDKIFGGSGHDRIAGGKGNDRLAGDGGNDVLAGDQGNDKLYGGAGDDSLDGGVGADQLFGGAGIDTVSYAGSAGAVDVSLARAVQSGGHAAGDALVAIEVVVGSSFDDRLQGSAAADRLEGGAGSDLIEGGDGADVLVGGAGIDTLSYAGSSAAVLVSLAVAGQQGGAAAGDTASEFENLLGSAFADDLTGDGGANTIDGGAGADVIAGGAGADTLIGSGSDTVSYATSAASVRINLAQALQSGGDAAGDLISGFQTVIASGLDDEVYGAAAAETLYGGAGNDLIDGSVVGADGGAPSADLSVDAIYGGEGRDRLIGGAGDAVFGDGGDDALIVGHAGAGITMHGGAGNDTVEVGPGLEATLFGDQGADQFWLYFSPLDGPGDGLLDGLASCSAVISDFEDGSDRLYLPGMTALDWFTAITAPGTNAIFDDAGSLVIQSQSGPAFEIRISGLSVADFSAADIITA